MKKLLIASIFAAVPFTAMAAGGHGPAGCGLGSEVIFKNANEWYEHVMAATTNGSVSGNQTFGMTSGTLGCQSANGPLRAAMSVFIEENLEQLAADSATGQGETLSALSELIGIDAADQATFNSAVKANFDKLFTSEQTTSGDVYSSLVEVMAKDAALAKYLG